MNASKEKHVHIIGGGIAGLHFAYLLSNHKNVQVHLYEKTSIFGGRIRTEYDLDGSVLYEKGPWRIHPSHKNVLELVSQLNLVLKKLDQTIIVQTGKEEDQKTKSEMIKNQIKIEFGTKLI